MEMARSLDKVSPLTVITNALNVAMQIGSLPDVNVFVVGGLLNRLAISTTGSQAQRDLSELVAQKAFIGISTVNVETGLTDLSLEGARTKRAMIEAAQEVILLADSSKWGRVGFAKVALLSAVHTIISDGGLPSDTRTTIESMGIRLIIA